MPILLGDGTLFGTLCAVDPEPRVITRQQVELLVIIARFVATELERDREAAARARAEAELAGARDAVLADLAHDLKNPLAIIRGGAQLLQARARRGRPLEPDWLAARLEQIVGATARMAALVDEQLDITRVRAGQPLALDRAPHDLCRIVRRAVEEHRTVARPGGLRLDSVAPPLTGAFDAPRIARLLDNLLSNAIKFNREDGDVTVTLGRAPDPDGSWAILTVADRGIGIPAPDLARLGERFFRGRNAVGRIGGTGLGLASAREVARGHGGTLTVASIEHVGTTVTVRLPLDPVAHAATAPLGAETDPGARDGDHA